MYSTPTTSTTSNSIYYGRDDGDDDDGDDDDSDDDDGGDDDGDGDDHERRRA